MCKQFAGDFVWNNVVFFSDTASERTYEYGGTFEPWNGPKVSAAKLKKSHAKLSRVSISSADESNLELLASVASQLKSIETRGCESDILLPIAEKLNFNILEEIDFACYALGTTCAVIASSSGVPKLRHLRLASWAPEPLDTLLDFLATKSGSLESLELPNAENSETLPSKLGAVAKENKNSLRLVSIQTEISQSGLFSAELLDSKNFSELNDECLRNFGLPASAFRFNGSTLMESFLKCSDGNLSNADLDFLFDLSYPSAPRAQAAKALVGMIPSPGSYSTSEKLLAWITTKTHDFVSFICSNEVQVRSLVNAVMEAVLGLIAFAAARQEGPGPKTFDMIKQWVSHDSKVLATLFADEHSIGKMTGAQLLHDTEWMISAGLDPNLMDRSGKNPLFFSLLDRPFLLQQLLALPGANCVVLDTDGASLFQRVLESQPPKNENECSSMHQVIELSLQHAPTPSMTAERILRSYQQASDEQKQGLLGTFSSERAVSVLFSNPALLAAFAKISQPDWRLYITPTVLEYVLGESRGFVNRVKVMKYFVFLHQFHHTGEKSLSASTATALSEMLWDTILERGWVNSDAEIMVANTFPMPEKIRKLMEAEEERRGE